MFTGSNGAYRRTKIVIDWINIFLCVAVVIMATVIFLIPANVDFLLPVVFGFGAVMNGLHAAKNYMRFESKRGHLLVLVTLVLAAVTVVSAIILW